MAYIRRLPSGKFQATVRHPSGRKVTKTDPLKRIVQAWATNKEREFRTGLTPARGGRRATVADWAEQWWQVRDVEASTARKDDSRWRNHVEPHWATWPLESITRLDVQKWVKSLTDSEVGPHAVHGSYQLLTAMLGDAVDHSWLVANPCRRIALPRKTRPDERWLSRHEYDRLQLALGATMTVRGGRAEVPDPHAPVWQALVGLACFTGLRPGELAGLDVEHIDLERRVAHVRQVVARLTKDGGGHHFGVRPYGKSERARRSVPFPGEVADLLWRVIADRAAGPVFTAPRGGRLLLETNWSRRVWEPALRQAGIDYVRPYVMRHTAASWLVQAGVPDRQIMAILGHADTHLIEVYAHLAPDAHDAVRAAWGENPGASGAHDAPALRASAGEHAGQ